MSSEPQKDPSKIKTILAATDFSATADVALDWALALARQHQARLCLVHALTLPAPLPDYIPTGTDFGQEMHEIALRKLEQTAQRVRDAGVAVGPRRADRRAVAGHLPRRRGDRR